MLLGLLGWIAVGLILGFIVSKVLNLHGDDPRLGIGVAVAGALIVGWIYCMISGTGIMLWNPWSILFAAIGAGIGLTIWHGIRSRYIPKEKGTVRRSY